MIPSHLSNRDVEYRMKNNIAEQPHDDENDNREPACSPLINLAYQTVGRYYSKRQRFQAYPLAAPSFSLLSENFPCLPASIVHIAMFFLAW